MGIDSDIEWTHHTFNPWWGCQRVSPGCENCYAETFDHRLGGKHWGPKSERKLQSDKYWRQPLAWNERARKAGERHRVFCASMADVFEDRVELDEPRDRLWELIRATPHLDWLLLTKRPEHFERLLPWIDVPWPNVWLGVTAENQEYANRRIPILLDTPAAVRFVSYEPALGPLDISPLLRTYQYAELHWIIAGAESGHRARPMNEAWVRGIKDQCQTWGCSFFYKQKLDGGRKVSLPMLDGRQWAEVPATGEGE